MKSQIYLYAKSIDEKIISKFVVPKHMCNSIYSKNIR